MGVAGPPLWATLLRGAHDVALLSLFGTFVFRLAGLPAGLRASMAVPLRRLALVSGASALALGGAWFIAEAGAVASTDGLARAIAAVPAFLVYLRFAQLLLAQLVLVAAALPVVRAHWPPLVLAGVALALQPWLGHAGQESTGLACLEILHLLGAAGWAGALLPLLLSLRVLPIAEAMIVFRRFVRIGVPCVVALLGSGPALAAILTGGLPGLLGSEYGRVALLKAALFVAALVLAARNQWGLTPRLAWQRSAGRALFWSVSMEAMIGLAIVLAAGWLAMLSPAHMP